MSKQRALTDRPASQLSVSRTAPIGSPSNPAMLSCRQEAIVDPGVNAAPQRGDLIVGPLSFPGGLRLATANPDYRAHGSYKLPPVLAPGSTVTITIAPSARSYVVMSNPYFAQGLVAATYHECQHTWGAFPQSFTFTDGRIRGCVPIEVKIASQPKIRHVTLALFDRSCQHRTGPKHKSAVGTCSAADTKRIVHGVVHAFNTGDIRMLNRLIAPTPKFQWFSAPGPQARLGAAADRRSTLPEYVRRRHRRHERLAILSFGTSDQADGNFGLVIVRRARDYPRRVVDAKGKVDCATTPYLIAWSVGSQHVSR